MRAFYSLLQVLSIGLLLLAAVLADPLRKYDTNTDDVRPGASFSNNKGVDRNSLRGIHRLQPQSNKQRAACPEDYSPCTCELSANGIEVTCVDIPVADITNVFYRTRNIDLYQVVLTASATGTVDLPADLLKDKRVQRIYLGCQVNVSPKLGLTIAPATFEFTRFNTTVFGILNCDLAGQTDMQYLNDFSVLNTLRIDDCDNIEALATLPTSTLPDLKTMIIVNSTGLGNVAFPDLTPARLELLHLQGNGLTDATVNSILVSVGSSSSSSSLQTLVLSNEFAMTKVPRIASFSNLRFYDVSFNAISFMSQSTLLFNSPVNFVGLKSIGLTAIEGGAFMGNYANAFVYLEDNKLTEFRADVFKSMLQQMAAQPAGTGGQVVVTGNPFDCGCGLAWLIRDNQALLPSVQNGVCGGFFRFEDLNPDSYANCP